jgi:hypothetical protein
MNMMMDKTSPFRPGLPVSVDFFVGRKAFLWKQAL